MEPYLAGPVPQGKGAQKPVPLGTEKGHRGHSRKPAAREPGGPRQIPALRRRTASGTATGQTAPVLGGQPEGLCDTGHVPSGRAPDLAARCAHVDAWDTPAPLLVTIQPATCLLWSFWDFV